MSLDSPPDLPPPEPAPPADVPAPAATLPSLLTGPLPRPAFLLALGQAAVLAALPSGGQTIARRNAWAGRSADAARGRARREADAALRTAQARADATARRVAGAEP